MSHSEIQENAQEWLDEMGIVVRHDESRIEPESDAGEEKRNPAA